MNEAIAAEQPFSFPQGVAGFPRAKTFGLIYQGAGDIACLQSIDCQEACLLVTPWDATRLGKPPTLSAEERRCLHLDESEEPLWMVVLNPFADRDWVTANMRAPIAINEQGHVGLQAIQADSSLPLRFRWMAQPKKAA